MKILRVFYWISLAICWFHLALSMFGPFGGPITIYHMIKRGMFDVMSGYNVYDLRFPPHSENPATSKLLFLNSAFTFLYYLTLFASVILPFLRNIDIRTKYYIGISLFLTAAFVLFIGRRIWRYLVWVYLGV